jgi:sensor histidine kinase YesM
MKQSLPNNIALLAILICIALGRICLVSPEGLQIAGAALAAEVIILTSAYLAATLLNVRILVPQLLLHNRFTLYLFSLLGFAITFTAIELTFERLLITHYRLPPGDYWYFSPNTILFFELLSATTAYFVSIAGTAIILFLRLWNHSAIRLQNLEEQRTRTELQQIKTSINPQALFTTLDQAADQIAASPSQVADMLMALSKQLRRQLYASQHRSHPIEEPPEAPSFNLSSPAMNWLTDSRWRICRHAAMIFCFMLIVSVGIDATWMSLLYALLLPCCLYLILIYFNIYVLTPRLMMRARTPLYLIAVTSTALVFVLPSLTLSYLKVGINGHTSLWMLALCSVSNVVRLSFPMISVSVALLFQRWVRNERHIAELKALTLRSELEQLQTQVNPHFLFNMLNNILVLTKKNPNEAATVLRKLSDMLKYQFQGFTKQAIRLADDVNFLTDYLNLEKLRRDNFKFTITSDNQAEKLSLPPLLFIPFVENAVKHNNDNRNLSTVQLRFSLKDDALCFECINSKPLRPMRKDEAGGLGLPNVRRRLDLLYGDQYQLNITENESTYSVQLSIKFKSKKI